MEHVQVLRQNLLLMKRFLVQCPAALGAHLLQKVSALLPSPSLQPRPLPRPQLDAWPHFKEEASLFSLRDLVEVWEGDLLPRLQAVATAFAHHIKTTCKVRPAHCTMVPYPYPVPPHSQTCSSRGVVCELCGSQELLYPFDRHTSFCRHCLSCFHKYAPGSTCGRGRDGLGWTDGLAPHDWFLCLSPPLQDVLH